MANRITALLDLDSKGFDSSLKGLRKSIADSDGAFNKFKTGAAGVFGAIQANAGAMALGAGAALVGFGLKAVDAFQDLAIEAGRMSEALGIPVEGMSQLMEVAGDLGISTGTLETSLGKMNQTAGKTPAVFDRIGASIAKNKDGTMDVNATFLNTVDALNAIPDAGARAAAAQQIFGKGWKDMAELIGKGSDEILDSMAAVSDGKMINEEEVEKARELRAAQDNLKDALEELALKAGGQLAPALTNIADKMVVLVELGSKLGWAFSTVGHIANTSAKSADEYEQSLNDLGYATDAVTGEQYKLSDAANHTSLALDDNTDSAYELESAAINSALAQQKFTNETAAAEAALDDHTQAIQQNNDGLQEAYDKLHNVTAAFADLRGEMSDRSGFLSIQTSFDELQTKGEEALWATGAGWDDAEQKARDYEQKQIDVKEQVIAYAEEVGTIPPAALTDIIALIDEGKLAEAERALANLMRPRTATGSLIIQSKGKGPGIDAKDNPNYAGATGGIVTQPTYALIGEDGPEAVVPLNTAPGASPLGKMSGNAGTVININMPPGSNGDDVVRALRQHVKRNGPIQGIT